MNSKQLAMYLGTALVLVGFVGLLGGEEATIVQPTSGNSDQPTLEVKRGNNLPTSTIDLIQGSGSLQNQGQQPQSLNAGSQLQPNAGADSLPKNY